MIDGRWYEIGMLQYKRDPSTPMSFIDSWEGLNLLAKCSWKEGWKQAKQDDSRASSEVDVFEG